MSHGEISEEELIAIIREEERLAYGVLSGTLADDREQNIRYWLRQPFGNERIGRSSAIKADVFDTVESMMPPLMKIFYSGDSLVEFTPVGKEDIEQAKQETDLLNHLILNGQGSFLAIYSFFHDALLLKNGYCGVELLDTDEISEERYAGLTGEEVELMRANLGLDAGKFSVKEEDDGYAVKLKLKRTRGTIKLSPIPPEEMLVYVGSRAVSLQDQTNKFTQRRTLLTLSDIRLLGYEVDDNVADDSDEISYAQERLARRRFDEQWQDIASSTGRLRRVTFRDSYIRIDYDGDGIAELRHVAHVGNTILKKKKGGMANETATIIPYASLTPIVVPHEHIGEGYSDVSKDFQLQNSTILRNTLDNMYRANIGRMAIDQDRVNYEDVLNIVPGPVRVKGSPGTALMPINYPTLGGEPLQLLEYQDRSLKARTGVSYSPGVNPNILSKTATEVQSQDTATALRVELVARIFAETGMTDLVRIAHTLLQTHGREELAYKIRGKWVVSDPREWRKRDDLIVNVGIGTGNKDQMLMHLQSISATQKIMREGGLANLVTDKNLYNAAHAQVENSGFRFDEFFTDPEAEPEEGQQPLQQQQNPEEVAAQAQAAAMQAEMALKERELAQKDRELDLKEKQMMIDAQQAQAELALKAREQGMKAMEGQVQALGGEGGMGMTLMEGLMNAMEGISAALGQIAQINAVQTARLDAPHTKEIRREDGTLLGRFTIQ